jgi:parvulin-like peptidyl-prolyl isomerase
MVVRQWRMPCLLLLFTGIGIQGCGFRSRSQPEGDAQIVRVGDRQYGMMELQRYFDSRLSDFRDSDNIDVVKSALLDSFVDDKLLLNQAEQMNIEPAPEDLQAIHDRLSADSGIPAGDFRNDAELEKSMAEDLRIRSYLHDHLFKGLEVTNEECEAYYEDHLDGFVRNDVVHVREILVEDEAQAIKIQASLKANRNKNFMELARIYSKAPTAVEGGDLGSFQRGELPEEFEKVVFPLAAGTISKIVPSQYGYHIFFVEEKIRAHQQKFYEVKDQIKEKLLLERQRAALDDELASLAKRIMIEVDPSALDFRYVGTRYAPRGGKGQ